RMFVLVLSSVGFSSLRFSSSFNPGFISSGAVPGGSLSLRNSLNRSAARPPGSDGSFFGFLLIDFSFSNSFRRALAKLAGIEILAHLDSVQLTSKQKLGHFGISRGSGPRRTRAV